MSQVDGRILRSQKRQTLILESIINLINKGNYYPTADQVAKESGIITNFQLESIRRFLRRFLKKKAQLFFRIFPNISITKKPNEIRLGRGKGKLKY